MAYARRCDGSDRATPGPRCCDSRVATPTSTSWSRPARRAWDSAWRHRAGAGGGLPELVVDGARRISRRDLDVVFLRLPHGESQAFVPELVDRGVQVVDLGADFRLKNAPRTTRRWYGHEHASARTSRPVGVRAGRASPRRAWGATTDRRAGLLSDGERPRSGTVPRRGAIARDGIVVNALSGASGAGRATSERLHFSRLSGNAEAYGLLDPPPHTRDATRARRDGALHASPRARRVEACS